MAGMRARLGLFSKARVGQQIQGRRAAALARVLTSPTLNLICGVVLVALQARKLVTLLATPHEMLRYVAYVWNFSLYALFALFRRAPKKITLDPWYWTANLVSALWGAALGLYTSDGQALLPKEILDGLSVLSVGATSWARISLGRSFGLVPALRNVVTGGAYRWVRHPVYSAFVLSSLPLLLGQFTWWKLAFFLPGLVLQVARALMEEKFLAAADPAYARYLEAVRFRFVPFVV